MKITESYLKQIIVEELTKADVRKIVDDSIKSKVKKELSDIIEDELKKALTASAIKTDVGEIAKEVLKKLYKDLAYKHPYIIDRIKV
jgi:transcriptional accessory protein Tex/SPT6